MSETHHMFCHSTPFHPLYPLPLFLDLYSSRITLAILSILFRFVGFDVRMDLRFEVARQIIIDRDGECGGRVLDGSTSG